MPSTGVAQIWITAVAYMPQSNSGIRNQVIPAGTQLVDRDDEIHAR